MLINLRNALMAGKRLPYDAEVEYLRSTGSQYVNTQYIGRTNTVFELDAAFDRNSGQIGNVYRRNQEKPYFALTADAHFFLGTQTTSTENYPLFGYSSNRRKYIYDANSGLCTCGGVSANGYPLLNDQLVPMYLFARNNGNNVPGLYCQMKVYGFKGWYGNQLVIDLIPVRATNEQSQSVGELYDRVSGKFTERHGDFVVGQDVLTRRIYRNAGTGAFAYGNDLKYPIPS